MRSATARGQRIVYMKSALLYTLHNPPTSVSRFVVRHCELSLISILLVSTHLVALYLFLPVTPFLPKDVFYSIQHSRHIPDSILNS